MIWPAPLERPPHLAPLLRGLLLLLLLLRDDLPTELLERLGGLAIQGRVGGEQQLREQAHTWLRQGRRLACGGSGQCSTWGRAGSGCEGKPPRPDCRFDEKHSSVATGGRSLPGRRAAMLRLCDEAPVRGERGARFRAPH